jgi:type VI protein secretion system component VasF
MVGRKCVCLALVGRNGKRHPQSGQTLQEKLKEAIVGELRRQAANQPQSLKVSDELSSTARSILPIWPWIAGTVAGGP